MRVSQYALARYEEGSLCHHPWCYLRCESSRDEQQNCRRQNANFLSNSGSFIVINGGVDVGRKPDRQEMIVDPLNRLDVMIVTKFDCQIKLGTNLSLSSRSTSTRSAPTTVIRTVEN